MCAHLHMQIKNNKSVIGDFGQCHHFYFSVPAAAPAPFSFSFMSL